MSSEVEVKDTPPSLPALHPNAFRRFIENQFEHGSQCSFRTVKPNQENDAIAAAFKGWKRIHFFPSVMYGKPEGKRRDVPGIGVKPQASVSSLNFMIENQNRRFVLLSPLSTKAASELGLTVAEEGQKAPVDAFGFPLEHERVDISLRWVVVWDPHEGYTFAVCAGLLKGDFKQPISPILRDNQMGWHKLDARARQHIRNLQYGLWTAEETQNLNQPGKTRRDLVLSITRLVIKAHLLLMKQWDNTLGSVRPPLCDEAAVPLTHLPREKLEDVSEMWKTVEQLKAFRNQSIEEMKQTLEATTYEPLLAEWSENIKACVKHGSLLQNRLVWNTPAKQNLFALYSGTRTSLMIRDAPDLKENVTASVREPGMAGQQAMEPDFLKWSPFYPYDTSRQITSEQKGFAQALHLARMTLRLLRQQYPCLVAKTLIKYKPGLNIDMGMLNTIVLFQSKEEDGKATQHISSVQIGPGPDEATSLLYPPTNRQAQVFTWYEKHEGKNPNFPVNQMRASKYLGNIPFYRVKYNNGKNESKKSSNVKTLLGLDVGTYGATWKQMIKQTSAKATIGGIKAHPSDMWLALMHDVDTIPNLAFDSCTFPLVTDGSNADFEPGQANYFNFPTKIRRAMGEEDVVSMGGEFLQNGVDVYQNVKRQRYVEAMSAWMLCDVMESVYGPPTFPAVQDYFSYSSSELEIADLQEAEQFLTETDPTWLEGALKFKTPAEIKSALEKLGTDYKPLVLDEEKRRKIQTISKEWMNKARGGSSDSSGLVKQGRTQRTGALTKQRRRRRPLTRSIPPHAVPLCRPDQVFFTHGGKPGRGKGVREKGKSKSPPHHHPRTIVYSTPGVQESHHPRRPACSGATDRSMDVDEADTSWESIDMPEVNVPATSVPMDTGEHKLRISSQVVEPSQLLANIHPFRLTDDWSKALSVVTGKTNAVHAFLHKWAKRVRTAAGDRVTSATVTIRDKEPEEWIQAVRRFPSGKVWGPKRGDTLSCVFTLPGTDLVAVSPDLTHSWGTTAVYLMHTSELSDILPSSTSGVGKMQYDLLQMAIKSKDFAEVRREFLLDSDTQAILQSLGDTDKKTKSKKTDDVASPTWTHVWQAGSAEDQRVLEETILKRWVALLEASTSTWALCSWGTVVCSYLYAMAISYNAARLEDTSSKATPSMPLLFLS